MPPVLLVLLLVWTAPHERFRPPTPGVLFDRPLLLTPAQKSAATAAANSASITQEAAKFVSSLMASTYVVALL